MNQGIGHQSGWAVAKEDEGDGVGGRGTRGGRQKKTESDTKLRPKLIACLLISTANDCHSLSQNGRERNPYPSVFNFYFLNNDPNKVFKYGGELSDLLYDNDFKMTAAAGAQWEDLV